MKKVLLTVVLSLVLALTMTILYQPVSKAYALGTNQQIAIPSYFYPGSLWTQLEQAAPTVGLTIINPLNGSVSPYDSHKGGFDQNYLNQVKSTQAKGITVLGYVWTDGGNRSLDTINKNWLGNPDIGV